MVTVSNLVLPAGGSVQAFEWLLVDEGFFLRGGLPSIRSEWWTLETVGDCGMLGRVRDLARIGLCSFLSRDLHIRRIREDANAKSGLANPNLKQNQVELTVHACSL